jgi:hypothetical protein
MNFLLSQNNISKTGTQKETGSRFKVMVTEISDTWSFLGVLHALALANVLLAGPCLSVCLSRFSWGYSIFMTGESLFLQGYSTCMTGGHCSHRSTQHAWPAAQFLRSSQPVHDLIWQCKNDLRRNNDIVSHQCSNDLHDVASIAPLKYQVFSKEHSFPILLPAVPRGLYSK